MNKTEIWSTDFINLLIFIHKNITENSNEIMSIFEF